MSKEDCDFGPAYVKYDRELQERLYKRDLKNGVYNKTYKVGNKIHKKDNFGNVYVWNQSLYRWIPIK